MSNSAWQNESSKSFIEGRAKPRGQALGCDRAVHSRSLVWFAASKSANRRACSARASSADDGRRIEGKLSP